MRQLLLFSLNFGLFVTAFSAGVTLSSVSSRENGSFEVVPDPVEPLMVASVRPIKALSLEKRPVKKLTCTDRWRKTFWNLLLKDKEFASRIDGVVEKLNCRDLFEIKRFDLNHDGKKEMLLWGSGTWMCGAVGNCWFGIIQESHRGYRILLSSSDYIDRSQLG